jgi:hypothetical protein
MPCQYDAVIVLFTDQQRVQQQVVSPARPAGGAPGRGAGAMREPLCSDRRCPRPDAGPAAPAGPDGAFTVAANALCPRSIAGRRGGPDRRDARTIRRSAPRRSPSTHHCTLRHTPPAQSLPTLRDNGTARRRRGHAAAAPAGRRLRPQEPQGGQRCARIVPRAELGQALLPRGLLRLVCEHGAPQRLLPLERDARAAEGCAPRAQRLPHIHRPLPSTPHPPHPPRPPLRAAVFSCAKRDAAQEAANAVDDDPCSGKGQGDCQRPACVWCKSSAVPSACYTPVRAGPGAPCAARLQQRPRRALAPGPTRTSPSAPRRTKPSACPPPCSTAARPLPTS